MLTVVVGGRMVVVVRLDHTVVVFSCLFVVRLPPAVVLELATGVVSVVFWFTVVLVCAGGVVVTKVVVAAVVLKAVVVLPSVVLFSVVLPTVVLVGVVVSVRFAM